MSRINLLEIASDAYRAVGGVEAYIRNCGLEQSSIELVEPRASLIHGCAFCIEMHSQDACRNGETELWNRMSVGFQLASAA